MSDSPQYDGIAESYQKVRRRLPVIEVFEHTLLSRLGEIRGKSALDLACGEGSNTRRLKESGTARTVGVDISTEMIRLAREQEQRDPLEIEYRIGAVQDLPVIEEFDMVTAIFLLNYAESSQELLEMCRAAHRNLKMGHRFLAINENISRCTADGSIFHKYGFVYPKNLPSRDAERWIFEVQVSAESWIHIDSRYFHRETYEWALRTAGLREVSWRDLVIPEELLNQEGDEYWSPLVTERPMMLIECLK
jgi:toxoflavin synthase